MERTKDTNKNRLKKASFWFCGKVIAEPSARCLSKLAVVIATKARPKLLEGALESVARALEEKFVHSALDGARARVVSFQSNLLSHRLLVFLPCLDLANVPVSFL
jgi:hypothetical protein